MFFVILLLLRGINDLNGQTYVAIGDLPILYDKLTGLHYDLNSKVKDTNIKNGTELILI